MIPLRFCLLAVFSAAGAVPSGGQVVISEFMAGNESVAADDTGVFSDWIEVQNVSGGPVNMEDWGLTDDSTEPFKWRFPAITLAAQELTLVRASDLNRSVPGQPLHTNFRLSAGGEYLGLTDPLGVTVSSFAPVFPPQVPDVSYGRVGNVESWFTTPTPGLPNAGGSANPGPAISLPRHAPAAPAPGGSLTITCRVLPLSAPVKEVTLTWRVLYQAAQTVAMLDDGAHGDGAAGDGIYGTVLASPLFMAGRMVRWKFTATDQENRSSRWPAFPDPLNSPEYLGTVIPAAGVNTQLPQWIWFTSAPSQADTDAGTRCSVYFKGEFYDNVFVRRRGGFSSTGSRKFDFNTGYHCFIDEKTGRVEEANINGGSSFDNTLTRPMISFEIYRRAGHAACTCFPVMQVRNGFPLPLSYFVEQVDERFLARHGYDGNGAMYKFVQRAQLTPAFSDAADGVEKKTRTHENNADLRAVVDVLNKADKPGFSAEARSAFMHDRFNLANLVNYAAARAIINEIDDTRKNWYFYCDTDGTGEWHLFPWDKDASLGVTADAGVWKPHPFFADKARRKTNPDQWSYLWEALFNDTRTRPMYLRRLRTLTDDQLQEKPGYLEERTDFWFAQTSPHLATSISASAIRAYFNTRRTQLYRTYLDSPENPNAASRLIPPAQPADAAVSFGAVESNPASGDQNQEYIEITNPHPFAVDLSGWKISGGIEHTFEPGTVILAGDRMYAASDAAAFRRRTAGPRGGQTLFVQGNWRGSLSARGEELILTAADGRVAATGSSPSAPTPAQCYLSVSELMYDPASGSGETEYIELHNTGTAPLDLSGASFTRGITFVFPSGSSLAVIAPDARVVLVKNRAAFTAQYGGGAVIAGEFSGSLANEGERLRMIDAAGEEIFDFTWSPAWHPRASGAGGSLVLKRPSLPAAAWNTPAAWRVSAEKGTPGAADSPVAADPPGFLDAPEAGSAGVLLIYHGHPGQILMLERSYDLKEWHFVSVHSTGASGTVEVTDTPPPVSRLFYRAAVP